MQNLNNYHKINRLAPIKPVKIPVDNMCAIGGSCGYLMTAGIFHKISTG